MVTVDDLKQIVMLTYLSDPMLENLAGITDVLKFDKDEIVFRQYEPAERYYMLITGNIVLEQQITENVTVCIGAIKPGFSFGWSAMIEGGTYSADAVCVQASEVLSFKRSKIYNLFAQDPDMGLRFYKRLLVIIKKRLDIRTEQFREAIKNHPDMQALFYA